MVRAVIQYEREPEPSGTRGTSKSSSAGASAARSGTARRSARRSASPPFAYYAEFEWADMDAFKAAARTEEFAASGKDAMEMGIPFTVTFVELEE